MRNAICLLFMILISGCTSGKDGNVDYHFNPPFSYHTLTLGPLDITKDKESAFEPKRFYKMDNRFSCIFVSVLVKGKNKSQPEEDIGRIKALPIRLRILDDSGNTVFTSTQSLEGSVVKNVTGHKGWQVRKDGSVTFRLFSDKGLGFGSFTPRTELIPRITVSFGESVDSRILMEKYEFALFLQEIRGK